MATIEQIANDGNKVDEEIKMKEVRVLLHQSRKQLAKAIPINSQLKVDMLIRQVVTALNEDTDIVKKCETSSIIRAVMRTAHRGLELSLSQSYLVPFYNKKLQMFECKSILGYIGMIVLAYRAGILKSLSVNVVYEGDNYQLIEGADKTIIHVPCNPIKRLANNPESHEKGLVGTKATPIAYYGIAHLSTGGRLQNWLWDEPDIKNKIAASPSTKLNDAKNVISTSPSWAFNPITMAKKVVVLDTLKLLPKSSLSLLQDDIIDEVEEKVVQGEVV